MHIKTTRKPSPSSQQFTSCHFFKEFPSKFQTRISSLTTEQAGLKSKVVLWRDQGPILTPEGCLTDSGICWDSEKCSFQQRKMPDSPLRISETTSRSGHLLGWQVVLLD